MAEDTIELIKCECGGEPFLIKRMVVFFKCKKCAKQAPPGINEIQAAVEWNSMCKRTED